MPEPARFQTERSQHIAVACVTIAAFLTAMALAFTYTGKHAIDHDVELFMHEVDGLRLSVPQGWTPQQGTKGGLVLLEPRDDPQSQMRRELTVLRIPVGSIEAPMELFRAAWEGAMGWAPSQSLEAGQLHRFRNKSLIGIRYHGQREIQNGAVARGYALLLTENARDYWLVTLRDYDSPTSASDEANVELIDQIAQSASPISTRNATVEELAQAHLPPKLPASLEPRVESLAVAGEPVLLALTTGGAQLGLVRALGTIDTGTTVDANKMSPHTNLSREFYDIHGRLPNDRELSKSTRGDVDVWKVTLSAGRSADTPEKDNTPELIRERYHVRMRNGHGLLFETLVEPSMYAVMTNQVDAIIAVATKQDDNSIPNENRFLDASRRGSQLGLAMRQTLGDRIDDDWEFMTESVRGQIESAWMTRWYRTDDDQTPLWGRAIRRPVGRQAADRIAWRASIDGNLIVGEFLRQRVNNRKTIQNGYQVKVTGDRIATVVTPAKGDSVKWADTLPPNYIPSIAEQVWAMPAVYNLSEGESALIWRSQGRNPPVPYFIDAMAIESESVITQIPTGAVVVLTIRPIMGMETTRIWLDAKGRTLRETWYVSGQKPAGGIRVDLNRLTRDAALRRFPQLQETIFQWLMEKPDPGMQP